ncbi:hypothetical protein OIU78_006641 [Salix suchowensis]|nr:hypothetical protein OIU78_006641 [Salix suchowensis]
MSFMSTLAWLFAHFARICPCYSQRTLNYDIYRDDITFIDPLNTFTGIDSYKLIFWASTFHGFHGRPRESFRVLQGINLDRNGKIYEHKVDNLAFSFPQTLKPAASVLDLVAACPASPNPTFLWGPVDICSSSCVEFYRAVRETLDQEQCQSLLQDGMVAYS